MLLKSVQKNWLLKQFRLYQLSQEFFWHSDSEFYPFSKIARKQNSKSKLHADRDFKVAPLLKVAFCQHQKKIVSLQFEISNYYVHVHSFVLCTYFWLPMPLVNHCNSKGQLFEGRKNMENDSFRCEWVNNYYFPKWCMYSVSNKWWTKCYKTY